MAEVRLSVATIMNLGLWERVCEYKEWEPNILSEGLITEDTFVTFDDAFERVKEIPKEIGLEDRFDEIKETLTNDGHSEEEVMDHLEELKRKALLGERLSDLVMELEDYLDENCYLVGADSIKGIMKKWL